MRSPPRLGLTTLVAGLALAASLAAVRGQTANGPPLSPRAAKTKPAAHHKPDPYQSPLATIMSSHLWTTVPQAQDFVRDSRPSPKALDYTPLTSQSAPDPVRPKPRDAANVLALKAELEASMTQNSARAGRATGPSGTIRPRKAKAGASTTP